MTAVPSTRPVRPENANDRLKRLSASWLWTSLISATVVHFAAFAFWPQMSVAAIDRPREVLTTLDLPDEIDLPEAPEPLEAPARPVMVEVAADEATIESTRWEDNPVGRLAPPPVEVATERSAARGFTPFDVEPRVQNPDEIVRALARAYPAMLRQAGIGGTVSVLFHVDETGRVQETQVAESSGHPALDEAALRVSSLYRFSPAMNRDREVAVWVVIPITFEVR